MTITGTASPPHVIQSIITQLQFAPALSGVLVRWGLLATLPAERERVYMLGTNDYRRVPYSGGHILRRESYDIRALLEVHMVNAEPAIASERFWDIVDGIDLALLEDPDFTYAHYAGELRVLDDDVTPAPDGWIARGTLRLAMTKGR